MPSALAYDVRFHEDSDADDEYERSQVASPTLPLDYTNSPTDSEHPSSERTPTNYTHAGGRHRSPTGLITQWSAQQCAEYVASLGLPQYGKAFTGTLV